MDKQNGNTNTTPEAWETDRRRQTAAMLAHSRAELAQLEAECKAQRELQDRDFARAREIHAELQAWVDGGEFPARAYRYARLRAQMNHLCNIVNTPLGLQGSVDDALDALAGATNGAYGPVDSDEHNAVDGVMSDPLRVACGFCDAPEADLEPAAPAGKAA